MKPEFEFVRTARKPIDFSVGLAKFCVRIGGMVVCPFDCEDCLLICEGNPPVIYTRCWRCDWVAYGRLGVLHIAESVHLRDHDSRIRRRAYELYEQREREDGHDVEDWLRAEEEGCTEKPPRRGVAARYFHKQSGSLV